MDLIFSLLPSGLGGVGLVNLAILALFILFKSIWNIKPMEVGLVRKRFGFKKAPAGSPVALKGEAGYQAELLVTGLRFRLWPLYSVTRHPFVQIPAGEVGIVIAQIGDALPVGAKSAVYKDVFGNFDNVAAFMTQGGQKGVQRPVLPPGTVAAIHPVGFLVVTKKHVYGVPVAEEYAKLLEGKKGDAKLTCESFGLRPDQLNVVRIEPRKIDEGRETGKIVDMIGIVTTLEGSPSPKGAMANRLGDFDDIAQIESSEPKTGPNEERIRALLAGRAERLRLIADARKPVLALPSPAAPAAAAAEGGEPAPAGEPQPAAPAPATEAVAPPNEALERAVAEEAELARLLSEEAARIRAVDAKLVEAILSSKNDQHNNYQDFQKFLDAGGRIGLQHDPLLYGAYNLNPFLVAVELVPMLVVNQGQVAVIKAYVGLATEDTSGADFKFGALVRPGHRGIWQEPLRTGKFAINPRVYSHEVVPTFILSLNWAEASSTAHNLDKDLKQIVAKSKEGFVFTIDLQVQIHVPDTEAPKVISIVGSMTNLVNEVLQAAVGNHFRDKLQSMPAIDFIEKRQDVQEQAEAHIRAKLLQYNVETRGVYIQDVVFPEQLVQVLTEREIANQKKATYERQKDAEVARQAVEQAKGTADQQAELAKSAVGVTIAENDAEAVKKTADGEAHRLTVTGRAAAVQTEAEGLAIAKALEEQQKAVGKDQTALINAVKALASGAQRFMPENLALTIGGEGGGNLNLTSLVPLLMRFLGTHPTAEPPKTSNGGTAETVRTGANGHA